MAGKRAGTGHTPQAGHPPLQQYLLPHFLICKQPGLRLQGPGGGVSSRMCTGTLRKPSHTGGVATPVVKHTEAGRVLGSDVRGSRALTSHCRRSAWHQCRLRAVRQETLGAQVQVQVHRQAWQWAAGLSGSTQQLAGNPPMSTSRSITPQACVCVCERMCVHALACVYHLCKIRKHRGLCNWQLHFSYPWQASMGVVRQALVLQGKHARRTI